jgi:regulator of RNase E activity RraA
MPPDLQLIQDQLYAGVIADILDELGYRNQVMEAAIRPVNEADVLVGHARTVLAVPEFHLPDKPFEKQIEATDALGPGDVVVVHMSKITECAFWGELFSTAARARGGVGAVLDGYIRDVRMLREMRFPVFAAGRRAINSKGRCTVAAYDVPVMCGGVLVHPGDLIFAEADGVVVVPQAVADTVITRALGIVSTENEMRDALLSGSTLRQAWDTYHVM